MEPVRAEIPPSIPPTQEPEAPEIGPRWALVPPGVYPVAFAGERHTTRWRRPVWLVEMTVTEGEHFGALILLPLNGLAKGARPTRGYALVSTYAIATGRRPPADLWRRRPSGFLADCVFRARVRTVSRDSRGVELPAPMHYSRLDALLQRVAGCPRCLR